MSQELFQKLETQYGLPKGLLDAVWAQESARGKRMLSPAGAQGHFQFMPNTAKQYGVTDPNDLTQSATGAAKYFSNLSKRFGGDLPKMLAGYNWGEGRVERLGLDKAPAETRNYIASIVPKVNTAPDILSQVKTAKEAGYSDDEIFKHLQASKSDKVTKAREAGYSDAEIAQHLGLKLATPAPKPAQPKEERSGLADFATGLKKSALDTFQGMGQIAANTGAAIANLHPALKRFDEMGGKYVPSSADMSKGLDAEVTARHASEAPAMDTWQGKTGNIAGSVAQLIGPGMASKAGSLARNLLLTPKNALQAGATGAGFGGVQAVGEGESRATNTAVGAVGSVAGYGLAKGAGLLFEKGKNALVRATTTVGNTQIDDEIAKSAATSGIDLSKIPNSMLEKVRLEVADALKKNPLLDPAAVARRLDFEALGIKGTKGQITRDPQQFAKEYNLRGIDGAGKPLADQFVAARDTLTKRVGTMGADDAVGHFGTSEAVIGAVKKADDLARGEIDKLYQAARDSSGRYANVNVKAFSDAANNALDEKQLGRFLPEQVRSLLNDVSAGKTPLNVNTLTQIDSVLAAAARKADDAGKLAISQVRTALNNAPIDDAAGAEAKAAFDVARAAALKRFKTNDSAKAIAAALDDVAPDKFFQRYVLGGDAREIKALVAHGGPEAKLAIRSQVLSHLEEALSKNQAAYNKALKNLGDQRLSAILTTDDLATLKQVGRVAQAIQQIPEGATGANVSGTAAAAMNLLQGLSGKVGNWPLLNIGKKSVNDYLQSKAASDAVTKNPLMSEAITKAASSNRLLGIGSAAGAGASRK